MAAVPCFPHRAQAGLDAVVPGGKGAAVWYPSHGGYLRNQSCGKHIHPIHLAKPIVDILVEMRECGGYAGHEGTIIGGGYICNDGKGGRISFNRGYTPSGFAEKVFHLHLREAGDNDELYFRDYLREHPEAAREYEELKLGLWKEYEHDRMGIRSRKKLWWKDLPGRQRIFIPAGIKGRL